MATLSFIKAFLGISALTLVPSLASDQQCGKSKGNSIDERVKSGEYPWFASLYGKHSDSFSQICGGTVIAPRVILTAGHCTSSAYPVVKPEELKVAVGKLEAKWDFEEKDAQKLDVERIVLHPSYKIKKPPEFKNDLALIILTRAINVSDAIQPVCLDWTTPVENGEEGTVVSWNRTSSYVSPSEIHLRAVKGLILDSKVCLEKAPTPIKHYITPDKFCINYTNDTRLGMGDSGSGLTIVKNNRHYLVGVAGLGTGSHSPTFLFYKVALIKEWIESVVKGVTSAS